jgi:hypothetical protein
MARLDFAVKIADVMIILAKNGSYQRYLAAVCYNYSKSSGK